MSAFDASELELVLVDEMIKLPTDKLLGKFGSGGHSPGSGSAAALLGLVSCKLMQTVVSLTNGRENYKGVVAQLTLANQDVIDEIEPVLFELFQKDTIQFDKVIQARNARKLAVDKKDQKVASDKALDELKIATEIPLEIAEKSIALAEKSIAVFDLGFKSARGDSAVAISAALAGIMGAVSIVYLNLTSFRGGEWATSIRLRADIANGQIHKLQAQLNDRINGLRTEVLEKEKQH